MTQGFRMPTLPDSSLWDQFAADATVNVARERALVKLATDYRLMTKLSWEAGHRDYQERITGRSTSPRHWAAFRQGDLWRVASSQIQRMCQVAVTAGSANQHLRAIGGTEPEWWKGMNPPPTPGGQHDGA